MEGEEEWPKVGDDNEGGGGAEEQRRRAEDARFQPGEARASVVEYGRSCEPRSEWMLCAVLESFLVGDNFVVGDNSKY